MNERSDLFHKDDLIRIAEDAGLAELRDATQWFEDHGVCAPAVSQYGDALIDTVVAAVGHEPHGAGSALDGVWNSGVTLGIAIGEARLRRPSNDINLDEMRALLRGAHPSFDAVDTTLVDLAHDDRIEPDLYDAIASAIFTVLNAYAELVFKRNQLGGAALVALETLKVTQRIDMTKPPVNPSDIRRAISTLEAALETAK